MATKYVPGVKDIADICNLAHYRSFGATLHNRTSESIAREILRGDGVPTYVTVWCENAIKCLAQFNKKPDASVFWVLERAKENK